MKRYFSYIALVCVGCVLVIIGCAWFALPPDQSLALTIVGMVPLVGSICLYVIACQIEDEESKS